MVPLSAIDHLPHPEPSFEALADRITYPELAHKAGVEGTVVAHFMVDEDGTVSHVEIVRGIGAGADEEVARMLESTRFAPARLQRQPIRVRMETVVEFRFESCMERTWRRPTPLARQKASGP
ncbi:MAG: TonB family protein [Bacteroidetes bacterium]|jgi:protein TonB|nr:TonB family protein [Bacteroidota bacterium]